MGGYGLMPVQLALKMQLAFDYFAEADVRHFRTMGCLMACSGKRSSL
jgi:hypothetical protein